MEDNRVKGINILDGEIIEGFLIILDPDREGSEWLSREAERLGIKTTVNPVDIDVRVEQLRFFMKEKNFAAYAAGVLAARETLSRV